MAEIVESRKRPAAKINKCLESILGHCVLMSRVWDGFIDSAPLIALKKTQTAISLLLLTPHSLFDYTELLSKRTRTKQHTLTCMVQLGLEHFNLFTQTFVIIIII